MTGGLRAADLLAHGVGSRIDLPVPLWLAVYGAGAAVVFSFAALGLLWPAARLRGDAAGRPLPAWLAATVERGTRWVLRPLVLALSLVVLAAALFGAPDAGDNPTPFWIYILFWVGLVPLSLLFGPFWRAVNPLRTVYAGFARLAGGDPADGLRPLPDRLGYWPAAGWLAVFTWIELVPPSRDNPRLLGVFMALYAAVTLVGAAVYGDGWFRRGDGFEVYSTLIGRLAPFGRREDGRLVVRNPLDGLAGLRAEPGLVAVVVVLLGSTAFDGLTRARWWLQFTDRRTDWSVVPRTTLVLVLCMAVVAATYVVATRLAARTAGVDRQPMPGLFVHSLVPIAVGYAVAHYFSLLLIDGQDALILASDPFDTGANLFGTARWGKNGDIVSATTIAVVQICAIVVGHVLGVVAAHDRAVARFPGRAAVRGQYPLLAVMVAYTLGGVALLLGT